MKHKQELIDLLMADAKIRYVYADEEGNTCAIGGMAEAFGWAPKPLKGEVNGKGIDALFESRSRASMMPALKKAIEHFGLTKDQVKLIQKFNDRWESLGARHSDLKALVESWEEEAE